MGNIFVVRHGQDVDNAALILNGHRDKPLTDLGRKQAQIVGEKLIEHNIQVVYSSPLKRAFQTAQIIARKLGIKNVVKYPNLIERDYGILTGKPLSDIPKFATEILKTDRIDYFLNAKDAEDFPTAYNRAKNTLEDIKAKNPNQNVLIVTHSDMAKMLRAAYHNWDWVDGLKTPFIENTGILELTPNKDIVE
jgi:broad specificity phosphatase PhoE